MVLTGELWFPIAQISVNGLMDIMVYKKLYILIVFMGAYARKRLVPRRYYVGSTRLRTQAHELAGGCPFAPSRTLY